MAGFFSKIKSSSAPSPTATKDAVAKKNEEPSPEVTPLEKMLLNAGPLRADGSDRFYGFENFGNTCYCNSIVQALFFNEVFREHVVNYPSLSPSESADGTRPRVNVTIRPPAVASPPANQQNGNKKNLSTSQTLKQRAAINAGALANGQTIRPEDKPDTPEYKKKQAMLKGPILELAQERKEAYGMDENTFTGLKDIFLALMDSTGRTGVISPQRFLEIFKRDNEMFRNSMHQDAHEFYGLVLNDIITNVEQNARKMQLEAAPGDSSLKDSVQNALGSGLMNGMQSPGTGWVHNIFEGLLTSETQCLCCGTGSQRDETFLDLSIDLEEHSSVTSCLRKFSDDEVLCERNKFHCDTCGGLEEAEKRMKVKRLPKVLTLHLKRFKYTEDYSRLQKLFHRVVYPYHLRLFNTTEEAEDPDRLYELYAVIVHIGGNAYHGHYVSIIKTKDRGWLLFDDEMVEPVDKHFVRNFFGDKPGMATAYVLFYQETTFDKVREEQEKEGLEEVLLATQAANLGLEESERKEKEKAESIGLRRQTTQPIRTIHEPEPAVELTRASTTPEVSSAATPQSPAIETNGTATAPKPSAAFPTIHEKPEPARSEKQSKEDAKREKKEREAAEKAAKAAMKQAEKDQKEQEKANQKRQYDERMATIQARQNEQAEYEKVIAASKKSAADEESARKRENGDSSPFGFLDRHKRGSKSMAKRMFSRGDKHERPGTSETANGDSSPTSEPRSRLSSALGRKKSSNLLS